MASTSSPRAAISGEELGRMLALMKDSDSVELKVTVPESEQRSAASRSGWTRSRRRSARSTSSTPPTWR